MGLFETSADLVAAVFEGAAGETVTYWRGQESLSVQAWRSPQPAVFAVDDGAGALVEYESWEWHLRAAVLESLGRPEPGDRLTAADGRVYEVLRIPGQGHYVGDRLFRLHTKKVEDG